MWVVYHDQAQNVWARDWGVMTEKGHALWYCPAGGFFRSVTKGFGNCLVRMGMRRWGTLKLVDGKVRDSPAPGWVAGRWRNQGIREGFWQRVRKETFLGLLKKTLQQITKKTTKNNPKNQPQPSLHWHFNTGRHYSFLCMFSLYPFLALTLTSPQVLW